MRKAAVIIGVDRTGGGLQPLESAAAGALELAEFLHTEGFEVACLTDRLDEPTGANVPVTLQQVSEAIEAFVTLPPRYHLLVVYFSGHGYWQARSDVWLLSGAPARPAEAINLRTAEGMAKYSGIPNVVFISDACRSIPNSRAGELIEGTAVFPNYEEITSLSKMDVFKATAESQPAYEVKVGGKSQSVLTAALMSAFRDPEEGMVRELVVGNERIFVVPNRRLEGFLPRKVNAILQSVDPALSQTLEINVPSSDDVYIARARNLPPVAIRSARSPTSVRAPTSAGGWSDKGSPLIGYGIPRGGNGRQVRSFLSGEALRASILSAEAVTNAEVAARLPRDMIDRFETGMCVVVMGARVVRASVAKASPGVMQPVAELLDPGDGVTKPGLVRLHSHRPLSVALQTDNGRCIVLACLPGYLSHAVLGSQGLENVSYVPSFNNQWRFQEYQLRKHEIDQRRALVALAVHQGRFKVRSDEEANLLARHIRKDKGVDPTLGIYAAHAFYQAGNQEELVSVQQFMRTDLNADIFDIRLLAQRQFVSANVHLPVVPFCPMLSQSWNLLAARQVVLPASLRESRRYLTGALWTTFEPKGADIIFMAMEQGDLLENSYDSRTVAGRETAG